MEPGCTPGSWCIFGEEVAFDTGLEGPIGFRCVERRKVGE
jgi:hypothetical protein